MSLFCGSCAVEAKLTSLFNTVICNDNHYYLIELYKALQRGYSPPRFITEEEYQKVKQNIKEYSPEYVGFVGFGSSFGGKWFVKKMANGKALRFAISGNPQKQVIVEALSILCGGE